MFSSIKWKFIVVYFLLVFMAMVIVGIFIMNKLEAQQITSVTSQMEQNIDTIVGSSSYIAADNWLSVREEIQATLMDWRLGNKETLYVIYNEDVPTIIASSSKQSERIIGLNALSYLDPILILEAFEGQKGESIIRELNENTLHKHLAYPVFSSMGKVKGILYMTSDLENIYTTVNEAKKILTSATGVALIITIFLGFLIASSITVPIRDVTKKAEEMAGGNFEQVVDVKSDDEIGQLANMFNHLTLKLKYTIEEMDLERSKLDTIFNYMAEGVVAIDTKGYVIHANPIAKDILKLEDEFLETENKRSFNLRKINLDNIRYGEDSSLEGDEIVEIDSQIYKAKYASFKNEKENIGGLIIVFQNITQEHKLDNMRKEFVANVSHELKTPITTIKSYTETLIQGDIDDETNNKFLQVIDNECDRMARLVRDLLQLSNMDYRKVNWNKSKICIKSLLKESISKLDFAFKEKEQRREIYLEEDIPNIFVDKDGIEQVILNIISNAIKYTEEKGNIFIEANSKDGYVNMIVKDNGLGIPKEDQNRIFERFYRVEKGRSRDLGGTGLGLAIAQQIVESHGGKISLESEMGKGTEVTISLPIADV